MRKGSFFVFSGYMRLWIDHNYGCSTVILGRIYVGFSWLAGVVNRFSDPDLKIDLELYAW